MWPPQSVNTWPTPAPLSVRATSSPPVIQSEGRAPSEPPRLSSPQPPRFTDSPPPAGPPPPPGPPLPQPHLGARVPEPPRPPLGSHGHIHRLASRRASPSLRGRRSARTATSTGSPRPAGPQPRDGLRLALPLTRISPT